MFLLLDVCPSTFYPATASSSCPYIFQAQPIVLQETEVAAHPMPSAGTACHSQQCENAGHLVYSTYPLLDRTRPSASYLIPAKALIT
jgi:hypothetical protein